MKVLRHLSTLPAAVEAIVSFAMHVLQYIAPIMQAQSGAESELPFTCTVMLLGISGCGKSSVINSLLGRQACATDAFGASTKKVPTFALRSSLCSLSVLKPFWTPHLRYLRLWRLHQGGAASALRGLWSCRGPFLTGAVALVCLHSLCRADQGRGAWPPCC